MRLGPYWATFIWTSKLDITDLVSTYDILPYKYYNRAQFRLYS